MKRFSAQILVLLLTGVAQGAEPGAVHEWPQYRGNSGFTGMSTDDSVKPPLKLVWSYRLDGDASSDAGAGVVVAGGKVFVNVHNTRSILALDAETGRFLWEYKATSVGYRTVPTYCDGRLFLWQRGQGTHYVVLALEAKTGDVLWQQSTRGTKDDTDSKRVGLPVADGKVFVSEGGEDPAVIAFDQKTGDRIWRASLSPKDGTCVRSPSVADGTVFVATLSSLGYGTAEKGAVTALNAATGRTRWRRAGLRANRSPASDGRGVVCISYSRDDQKSYYLDAQTGDILWTGPQLFHFNSPTITDDLVLIRPYGAACHAFDKATGKPLWQFQVPKVTSGCCSPAISGRYAYFGTGVVSPGDLESIAAFGHPQPPREQGISGTMHAIDLQTGKSVWQFSTANCICGDPALAYGKLYFHSRDGRVYCFAPAKAGESTVPDATADDSAASADDVAALLEPSRLDHPRPGCGWPMQGGGPDRAGLEVPELRLPLEPAWQWDAGGPIVAAAAIRDGKAFIGSDSGKIAAVELATGQKAWEYATGGAVHCSPAVVGGLVYCGSDARRFVALDAATGLERWTFPTAGPVRAAPAVVGDVVLFGADDHHIYALNRLTGKKLWTHRVNDYCIQAPPVVHGDRVFAAQWTDWVRCLDLKTGRMQWQSTIPITIEALAWYRDRLYVRNPNYLVELDPQTGKRLRVAAASWGWGGMAFADNQLFHSGIQSQYGTNGATSIALDDPGVPLTRKIPSLEDALMLKPKALKGASALASMASPLALGKQLVFAAVDGIVTITDLDGTKRWSHRLGGTCHAGPAASDGYVLVGCDDGKLYAFRESSK